MRVSLDYTHFHHTWRISSVDFCVVAVFTADGQVLEQLIEDIPSFGFGCMEG